MNYDASILKVDTQGENCIKSNSFVQNLLSDDYGPPKQCRTK